MPSTATVVRYLRTVVVLGVLTEFIDGGTYHFTGVLTARHGKAGLSRTIRIHRFAAPGR